MKNFLKKLFTFKTPKRKRLWLRWLWPIIILTTLLEMLFGGYGLNPMYYSFLIASAQTKKFIIFALLQAFKSVLISLILVSIVNFCVSSRIFRYSFLLLILCYLGDSFLTIRTKYCYPIMFQSLFSKLGYHACDEIMDIDFFVKEVIGGEPKEKRVKLKLPRYYMPEGINKAEEKFTFYLAEPTFEPYYKASLEHREKFQQPVKVEVILKAKRYKYKYEPILSATHIEDIYNLKGYILENEKPKITPEHLKYATFYYYPQIETNVGKISCGRSHHYPGESNCHIYTYLADHFEAEILINSRLLKDWEKIDEAARKTFLSFLQD